MSDIFLRIRDLQNTDSSSDKKEVLPCMVKPPFLHSKINTFLSQMQMAFIGKYVNFARL